MRTHFAAMVLAIASLLAVGASHAASAFRGEHLQATEAVAVPLVEEKDVAPAVEASGRMRVGTVRALAKSVAPAAWTAVPGGYVARLRSTSPGAAGLRVRLALGALPGPVEVRVQGADGAIEAMVADPVLGPEAWTPWTEGESQVIELFSLVRPAREAVQVGGMLHFSTSPFAKAAASCTLSTACSSNDPALDAAIAERKKSVVKIQFIDGNSGYVCSATLIDTPARPAAYLLTANHCIDSTATAGTMTSFWFYEASACGALTDAPGRVQVGGGAQLTFTNFNIDSTLLLLNANPPPAAVFSPINAGLLNENDAVVSISHPRGDSSRWATGTAGRQLRDNDRPYNMYGVNYSRGIIEPGSSGSGVFTMNAGGQLELRGVLSQGDTDLSCTQPTLFTLYGRLEAFYPQVAQYLGGATRAPDDAPNRPAEVSAAVADAPLDTLPAGVTIANRRIDYAGDVDLFRFTLARAAYVTVFTEGSLDTVGTILDANGRALEANDDADWSGENNLNFGLTRRLAAGTYLLHVADWQPSGTGTYTVKLRADDVDTNYTDLWWNAAESGWGININHQGNILFATLFTYDASGAPMWLVMSSGTREADGGYSGALYRTTGAPFNAPWSAASVAQVGTMRLQFLGNDMATLSYSVDGVAVNKTISRQVFSSPPTCAWSGFDRANISNYQDLWFNPAEPGWGLNLTHQGATLFGTLFTYGADGRGLWLVMSSGARNVVTGAFTGALYRTTGPAFNASPWTPATTTQVGTMSITFAHGNAATLTYSVNGTSVTKQIQRQVFANPKTECTN